MNFSQGWIDTETRFDSNLWANVRFSAMSPWYFLYPLVSEKCKFVTETEILLLVAETELFNTIY